MVAMKPRETMKSRQRVRFGFASVLKSFKNDDMQSQFKATLVNVHKFSNFFMQNKEKEKKAAYWHFSRNDD